MGEELRERVEAMVASGDPDAAWRELHRHAADEALLPSLKGLVQHGDSAYRDRGSAVLAKYHNMLKGMLNQRLAAVVPVLVPPGTPKAAMTVRGSSIVTDRDEMRRRTALFHQELAGLGAKASDADAIGTAMGACSDAEVRAVSAYVGHAKIKAGFVVLDRATDDAGIRACARRYAGFVALVRRWLDDRAVSGDGHWWRKLDRTRVSCQFCGVERGGGEPRVCNARIAASVLRS